MENYKMNVSTVVVDIETVPQKSLSELEERAASAPVKVPKNYKDEAKIKDYINKNQPTVNDYIKAHSLNPIHGRICSIAVDIDGSESVFYRGNELQILQEFMAEMPDRYRLISFNGIGFDIPFINRRLKVNGFSDQLNQVSKYDKTGQHIDLFLLATENGLFTSSVESFGLKALCEWFGIDHSGGEGSDVFKWYQAGELDRIAYYNMADVRATRELAFRLGELSGVAA